MTGNRSISRASQTARTSITRSERRPGNGSVSPTGPVDADQPHAESIENGVRNDSLFESRSRPPVKIEDWGSLVWTAGEPADAPPSGGRLLGCRRWFPTPGEHTGSPWE